MRSTATYLRSVGNLNSVHISKSFNQPTNIFLQFNSQGVLSKVKNKKRISNSASSMKKNVREQGGEGVCLCLHRATSVGYNFASRNQKKKCQESFFFESRNSGKWLAGWGKSRRRTGDGYLTNFATPSSQRVRGRRRWKKRRRDR
jgi:hypothetical protein